MENKKSHWDAVYQTKSFESVSWFQSVPETSIQFFEEMNLHKDAHIIDIGAGESHFVDYLMATGYTNITLVDISEEALERTRQRLGNTGTNLKYIVADVGSFIPTQNYDFWHDRATFHFLTDAPQINHYLDNVKKFLNPNGHFLIGTFDEDGPTKCSGLEIKQYSESSLTQLLNQFLKKVRCLNQEHLTPFGTLQKFIFCYFRKPEIVFKY